MHYSAKLWTNHERKAAQARSFRESQAYILPIRLDDTEVEGVLPTTGYLRWPPKTAAEISDLLVKKLQFDDKPTLSSPSNYHLIKRLRREGMFYSVAFSHDGRYLIAAGQSGALRWEIGNARSEDLIKGYTKTVSFSSDGGFFAALRGDSVAIWSTADWKEHRCIKGKIPSRFGDNRTELHEGGTTDVCLSPSGLEVATVGGDNTVKIWDAISDEELTKIELHDRPYRVRYSPNGRVLVIGGRHYITFLDTKNWQELRHLGGEQLTVEAFAFMVDGKKLFTVCPDKIGTVIVWNGETLEEEDRFQAIGIDIRCIGVGGTILGVSDWGGSIKLFDMARFEDTIEEAGPYKSLQTLVHDDAAFDLCFSSDTTLLAAANRNGQVNVWSRG